MAISGSGRRDLVSSAAPLAASERRGGSPVVCFTAARFPPFASRSLVFVGCAVPIRYLADKSQWSIQSQTAHENIETAARLAPAWRGHALSGAQDTDRHDTNTTLVRSCLFYTVQRVRKLALDLHLLLSQISKADTSGAHLNRATLKAI